MIRPMTVAILTCTALAPWGARAADDGIFTLGEVHVAAPAESELPGTSTLTLDQMRLLNRDTLDDALATMAGASVTRGGSSRNEANYYIRGMDRTRVPLYIDGIRVYLPYDNRLDMARFTTTDVAEIQVTKGYSSVINGPGAMGGSVNLVSRRPTSALDGDLRSGVSLDGNGAFNGFTSDAYVGSLHDQWYVQGSGQWAQKDHFRVSEDFGATRYENGGNRNESGKEDYKVNLKVGYVPEAGDEYAINYIEQNGRKSAPPNAVYNDRYWRWPEWGKKSLYWLSNTSFGTNDYIKVRAFYDWMDNRIKFYANDSYTAPNANQGVWSRYQDTAFGGSVEGGLGLFGGRDLIRVALHARSDTHRERSQTSLSVTEPWQDSIEQTYSAAIENTFRVTQDWDVIAGLGYDIRNLEKAEDWSNNRMVPYRRNDDFALNPQLATIYRYSDSGKVSASIERRTRFPTLFERFSSRFGLAYGNPDLKAEKSLNTQIGIKDSLAPGVRGGVTLFHSYLDDAIVSRNVAIPVVGTRSVSFNSGKAQHQGVEVELSAQPLEVLEVGANYTFMVVEPGDKSVRLTGVPRHKAILYADWEAFDAVHAVPSVELGSERWMQNSWSQNYYRGGDYALVNFKASWKPLDALTLEAGAKNIFDVNYNTVDGFPEEGRNYFADVRVTF